MKKLLLILLLVLLCARFVKALNVNTGHSMTVKIQNHFVFITVHLNLVEKTSLECVEESSCLLITDVRNHVMKINEYFVNTPMIVGSGFVFRHKKNETKILTSNHVCVGINSYIELQNILSNSKDEILNTLGENKSYNYLDIEQIKNNYNIKPAITLFDFYGNKYEEALIEKQNKSNDLCILSNKNIIGEPVKLQKGSCKYGEEVINISASDGNYFPNAVPYHIGAYSGSIKNKRFSLFGKNEEVSLYTLDIDQGSSGSGVFSKKTKQLCGNINAIMKNSNLSIGSTNNSIIKFVD